MKLLIDSNAYHKIFDPIHKQYGNFQRLRECLFFRKGVLVYGGTTFLKELEKLNKFLGISAELKKQGKLKLLSKELVDAEEKRIKKLIKDKDFDDPHLVACCILGVVEIVVTEEHRAVKYIKDKVEGVKIYPAHIPPPKIFKSSRNNNLLINCFR
ncbi:MAG: hypothetical protein JNM68_11370 [Dinghuibacter sp.]|nr:hypothetical protein [Dinghuibacter sp.]